MCSWVSLGRVFLSRASCQGSSFRSPLSSFRVQGNGVTGVTVTQLVCWVEDQRMAHALGELDDRWVARVHAVFPERDLLAEPPGSSTVRVFKELVRETTGRPSVLAEQPTWQQMAEEARATVTPGAQKWLNSDGEGYFTRWALDHPGNHLL